MTDPTTANAPAQTIRWIPRDRRAEGVQALAESALELVGSHGSEATPANGPDQRMISPNATARATRKTMATRTRVTFRQFGSPSG